MLAYPNGRDNGDLERKLCRIEESSSMEDPARFNPRNGASACHVMSFLSEV